MDRPGEEMNRSEKANGLLSSSSGLSWLGRSWEDSNGWFRPSGIGGGGGRNSSGGGISRNMCA